MTDSAFGWAGLPSDRHGLSEMLFIFNQQAMLLRTGVPVIVKAVHDGGDGLGPAPTVDVQPLVNQWDGQGNQTAHGTVNGLPVLRVQGGKNAIIANPEKDDIGWVVMADRDISAVKANKGKVSNPGSKRHHNLADGVYIGAILNPANPTQYVQFTSAGLKIADKNGNKIELKSGEIDITTTKLVVNGDLSVTGKVEAAGAITAGHGGGDSVGLQTHTHPSNGVPPTPGT